MPLSRVHAPTRRPRREYLARSCGLELLGNSTASRSDTQCGNQLISVLDYECIDATSDECPAGCKEALQEQEALKISKGCAQAAVDYWFDSASL